MVLILSARYPHKKPSKAGGFPSLQSTIKHIVNSQQPQTNIRNLLRANKDKGFDCPGCAWGDQKEGFLQFCENGAKAIAWESTSKKVDADFFARHTVSFLNKQSDYWLEYQGRLTQPMYYDGTTDHYRPIAWDDAFELIATTINNLKSPHELELYTSGRASNEVAYLYQLFGRLVGTNNFPDCSNMCHEASGVALNESIGVGKGTVVLEDFYHADAIFVFGQNPGTNHPRMMNALRKAAKNNCKIVAINNLKEVALEKFASPQDPIELLTPSATTISHLYLTPKLGGDMAVVRGMAKVVLTRHEQAVSNGQEGLLDMAFIKRHGSQFEQYKQLVHDTEWPTIEAQSGLTQQQITQAADVYLLAEKVICTWAMGITQHRHSVATIQEIVNLQLLRGNIGKQGAGLCPVRGHSNVQGNRTVGINEKPPAAFMAAQANMLNTTLPEAPGHNVYRAINALLAKKSKVLICLGGNLAAAANDSQKTYQAMQSTTLNVQISTKLNRSHLQIGEAALILPCLGRTEIDMQASGEQFITVEDTFSMVHASQGNVAPISDEVKSEIAIIGGIAKATLGNKTVDWQSLIDDYNKIRDMIEQVLPQFVGFNHRLETPGGFYLGNSARELNWHNAAQRALFAINELPTHLLQTQSGNSSKYKQLFTLQSLRSHDQYNTTIYGMNDRYRGIVGERKVLFINPKDAQRLECEDGDLVDITSVWENNQYQTIHKFKLTFYDIPRGNLAAYYPETNPLVPLDSVGLRSYTPTSKAIAVFLTKSPTQRIL